MRPCGVGASDCYRRKEMKKMDFGPLQGSISQEEFVLFRDYVLQNCGIVIPPEKAYLFETRLAKLMTDAKADSFSEFYRYVILNKDPMMQEKIINAITTNRITIFSAYTTFNTHLLNSPENNLVFTASDVSTEINI